MSPEGIGFNPETEQLAKDAEDMKRPDENVKDRTLEQFQSELRQTIDRLAVVGVVVPGGRITILPHILELSREIINHDQATIEMLSGVETALLSFVSEPVNPNEELTEAEHDHVLAQKSETDRINLTNRFLSNHRSVKLLRKIQPYINEIGIRDQ